MQEDRSVRGPKWLVTSIVLLKVVWKFGIVWHVSNVSVDYVACSSNAVKIEPNLLLQLYCIVQSKFFST